MLHLSASMIESHLQPLEIIEVLRKGLMNIESGVYQVPKRMHLESQGISYLLMPAMGERYFCTKLVSVVPSNAQRKLPTILGSVLLGKKETGESLALLDAPMITALRTAAVGAIGLDLITPKKIEKIGIIGLGVQGVWQTIFACSIRDVKAVYCFSRTKEKFVSYQRKVLEKCPHLTLVWCENGESVVRESEIIYTCTTSSQPVFSASASSLKNKRFISIGSFQKDMQELPQVVYENAAILLVDTLAAKEEVGDVINAIENNWMEEEQVFEIGKVLTRERKIDVLQNIVFKSVGMAAFDLALASAVYEKALKL